MLQIRNLLIAAAPSFRPQPRHRRSGQQATPNIVPMTDGVVEQGVFAQHLAATHESIANAAPEPLPLIIPTGAAAHFSS